MCGSVESVCRNRVCEACVKSARVESVCVKCVKSVYVKRVYNACVHAPPSTRCCATGRQEQSWEIRKGTEGGCLLVLCRVRERSAASHVSTATPPLARGLRSQRRRARLP